MGNTERTPLLQVVKVGPPTERYPHRTIRRLCTAFLSIIPVIVIAAFLVILCAPADSGLRPLRYKNYLPSKAWPGGNGISHEELEEILLSTPDEARAKEWSEYYTSGPHLAGKNLSQAVWTHERWRDFGIASEIVSYDVYINYPKGARVALLKEKTSLNDGDDDEGDDRHLKASTLAVKYEARLEENVHMEDKTSGLADRIPVFNGYSANGNVTAQYVYANYGTYSDFEDLMRANVSLEGKIALVKYGVVFRGLKVKRAQELGMIGALMYSDPGDDGDITEKNGYLPYPIGPAREPSSVQRGSVEYLNMGPGDPTTPGYPSKPGAPRQEAEVIPKIPSMPMSYQDALPLLKALNHHGPKAQSLGKHWEGGGLDYKGVEYNIGPSPPELKINLVNEQEYVTTPLWNVIGIINGTIPDEVVILGNHRDAWIAGGAGDPNSGTAALMEVARSFSVALAAGWKPLRTIVLASWDGEEYGLIGSTEWVEEYLPWLSSSAVAYLNVDVGTAGPRFLAAAAPLLNDVLVNTTRTVLSPNQTIPGQTVADVWDGIIHTMGSGSDFTAFQDFAGIPSVDLGFKGGKNNPVYHYHSNYDSFSWMEAFGDPHWEYHTTITKIWSILAAKLVDTPVIPFNTTEYAANLLGYMRDAKIKAEDSHPRADSSAFAKKVEHLFQPLSSSIHRLSAAAVKFDAKAAGVQSELDDISKKIPWWKWWQKVKLYLRVRAINTKYKTLERQFLYAPGLDGRDWFKHVVFAPGLWTGYSGATFPGIVEGLERGIEDWESVRRWIGIVSERVESAVKLLDG